MTAVPTGADRSRLYRHLEILTNDIGIRLAGSDEEQTAADYIAEQFRRCGANVKTETFPVQRREVFSQHLEIKLDHDWVSFPCSLFSSTPGTDNKFVEAPLVFYIPQNDNGTEDLSRLTGKAVVHLGSHIESREAYARLIAAKPAFLLLVDIRYPGDQPLADGMFPAYTASLGAVPTINVAFADAWRWKAEAAERARLCVDGGMIPAMSQNVIAEFPGDSDEADILFCGAHHDTQADSPGTDDNGSGVAVILELARILGPRKRQRSLRLISFGAEEQLSVGSAAYVRRHREEITRQARLMFNFDACGSLLGWTNLTCNGPVELADYLGKSLGEKGCPVRILPEVMPYADHFAFVAAGVPGVYLGRSNCATGRFFHHRPDDDLSRISPDILQTITQAAAETLIELDQHDPLPFQTMIAPEQATQAAMYWRDLFGGWAGY